MGLNSIEKIILAILCSVLVLLAFIFFYGMEQKIEQDMNNMIDAGTR